MRTTLIIITTLALLGVVSAVYPGETLTYSYGDYITGVNVTGNLTALNISLDGNKAYITIPSDFQPSNFSIQFEYLNSDPEIVRVSSGGGGGGGSTGLYRTPQKEVVYIVNNTESEEKEINNSVPIEINLPEIAEGIVKTEDFKKIFGITIMCLAGVIIIIAIVIRYTNEDYGNLQ